MKNIIRNGEEGMHESEQLMSFIVEFEGKELADIINGAFVARSVFKIKVPYSFTGKGSLGVDSSEMRRILVFNKMPKSRNHRKACLAAKQLSKIKSKELGWLAQYIYKGKTHLYKEEAIKASRIKEELSKIRIE